jgi:hypothetical protein
MENQSNNLVVPGVPLIQELQEKGVEKKVL